MELKTRLNRRSLIAAGATALVALGAGISWKLGRSGPRESVKAGAVTGELPIGDPESKLWNRGKRLKLPLLNQTMFYPRLWQATIPSIEIRALFNGEQVAFRAEWGDQAANDLESIVGFRDALAVMLPLDPTAERPPIFMGSVGKPVYILQWKASWQRDVAEGFQGVEKTYPNWFNDLYPGHPTWEALGMSQKDALPFYPGLAVGNTLSQQNRTSPVEELVAEGYGTLTSLSSQRAQGKGIQKSGKWQVSLGLPSAGDDLPALKPGMALPVAFAAWDGGDRQVGGRKHYSDWITVELPGG